MALTDVLKHIALDKLTDEQRTDLTRRLQKHRRDLRSTLTVIEQTLEQLGGRPSTPPPEPTPTPARTPRTRRSTKS